MLGLGSVMRSAPGATSSPSPGWREQKICQRQLDRLKEQQTLREVGGSQAHVIKLRSDLTARVCDGGTKCPPPAVDKENYISAIALQLLPWFLRTSSTARSRWWHVQKGHVPLHIHACNEVAHWIADKYSHPGLPSSSSFSRAFPDTSLPALQSFRRMDKCARTQLITNSWAGPGVKRSFPEILVQVTAIKCGRFTGALHRNRCQAASAAELSRAARVCTTPRWRLGHDEQSAACTSGYAPRPT